MAEAWKAIRVFISSALREPQAERYCLKVVDPCSRELDSSARDPMGRGIGGESRRGARLRSRFGR